MNRQEAAAPTRSILSVFRDHPASVGESYTEHMAVAFRFGARLFCAACAAFVHAFIPALFKTRVSDTVKAMHAETVNRGPAKGCPAKG